MIYPVLTYSRNLGDFTHDLKTLHQNGLKGLRLIYKGKTEEAFTARLEEIQGKLQKENLELDIWIDLPGKKPISGDLGSGLDVQAGMEIHLSDREMETSAPLIPTVNFFTHASFPELTTGDIISIADGELNLRIKEVQETCISCEALNSFFLTSNRSLNVKSKHFDLEANSEADLQFVSNLQETRSNVKLVVSFARKAADLLKLKTLQPNLEVIPKIETPVNEQDLLGILACCETVLLGRGDLSIALKPNELFAFQQHLIHLCQKHGKQLVVGTGLLTTISDKQDPTIAEVMDYSQLRHAGVNGFLLAGSNALNYPLETLKFMRKFEK